MEFTLSHAIYLLSNLILSDLRIGFPNCLLLQVFVQIAYAIYIASPILFILLNQSNNIR